MIYVVLFALVYVILPLFAFRALRWNGAEWEPYKNGYVRCTACGYIGPEPAARCPGCNAKMKK